MASTLACQPDNYRFVSPLSGIRKIDLFSHVAPVEIWYLEKALNGKNGRCGFDYIFLEVPFGL